jgi:hypothetical protein
LALGGAVAGESPYWNPKTETLSREQLESLQANVRAALALMHNVVNGQLLVYEHLSDLGV